MAGRWGGRWWGVGVGLALVGVGLAAIGGWQRWSTRFDRDRAIDVPLAASPALRDVVEPIAPVRGESWAGSDDHWLGITYRDARGVERTAKFVYYWPGPGPDNPGIQKTVLLGDHRVEPSSREERACLGLLERWWRGNDAAHALWDRALRRDPTLRPVMGGVYEGVTPAESAQIMAARLIRILRSRN